MRGRRQRYRCKAHELKTKLNVVTSMRPLARIPTNIFWVSSTLALSFPRKSRVANFGGYGIAFVKTTRQVTAERSRDGSDHALGNSSCGSNVGADPTVFCGLMGLAISSSLSLRILCYSSSSSSRVSSNTPRQGLDRKRAPVCSPLVAMAETSSKRHRLISIGPSHYCEKARWALERAYIAFTEDKHAPLVHLPFTRGLPGGTSCPKLVIGNGPSRVVLGDSGEILQYADKKISKEEDRLYPSDPEAVQFVKSWESKFDDRLGPHVRRYAYSHLLFVPSTYKLLTQGSSRTERTIVRFMMPLLRRLLFYGLECDKPENREQSLQEIDSVFKEVDGALADGRPYICGSKFTAADLTFAALGGPMVAPPESGTWNPPTNEYPSELAAVMKRLQATPAGQHILKTYETKRRRPEAERVL